MISLRNQVYEEIKMSVLHEPYGCYDLSYLHNWFFMGKGIPSCLPFTRVFVYFRHWLCFMGIAHAMPQ